MIRTIVVIQRLSLREQPRLPLLRLPLLALPPVVLDALEDAPSLLRGLLLPVADFLGVLALGGVVVVVVEM